MRSGGATTRPCCVVQPPRRSPGTHEDVIGVGAPGPGLVVAARPLVCARPLPKCRREPPWDPVTLEDLGSPLGPGRGARPVGLAQGRTGPGQGDLPGQPAPVLATGQDPVTPGEVRCGIRRVGGSQPGQAGAEPDLARDLGRGGDDLQPLVQHLGRSSLLPQLEQRVGEPAGIRDRVVTVASGQVVVERGLPLVGRLLPLPRQEVDQAAPHGLRRQTGSRALGDVELARRGQRQHELVRQRVVLLEQAVDTRLAEAAPAPRPSLGRVQQVDRADQCACVGRWPPRRWVALGPRKGPRRLQVGQGGGRVAEVEGEPSAAPLGRDGQLRPTGGFGDHLAPLGGGGQGRGVEGMHGRGEPTAVEAGLLGG